LKAKKTGILEEEKFPIKSDFDSLVFDIRAIQSKSTFRFNLRIISLQTREWQYR
jgi:hypothetical protein